MDTNLLRAITIVLNVLALGTSLFLTFDGNVSAEQFPLILIMVLAPSSSLYILLKKN